MPCPFGHEGSKSNPQRYGVDPSRHEHPVYGAPNPKMDHQGDAGEKSGCSTRQIRIENEAWFLNRFHSGVHRVANSHQQRKQSQSAQQTGNVVELAPINAMNERISEESYQQNKTP